MRQNDNQRTREALAALSAAASPVDLPSELPPVVRTPEERFEGIAGFPFEPSYRQLGGLRLAHVDEGEGPPVLFLHGSPTWGYLWRDVILPVRDAGYRCIVPDQVGYGRSDKPTDLASYTYDRYVETGNELLERLDLREVTLVVHDWGSPVGMRIAAEQPERIRRLVVMNGTLPLGQAPSEAWEMLRQFIQQTPDLPVEGLIRGGCHTQPSEAAIAAYEAPFPSPEFKAGPRAGPLLRPTSPEHPDAVAGRAVREALRVDGRPKLLLWGEHDPIMPPAVGESLAGMLGCEPPILIAGASHFLQEDKGREIGAQIASWLESH
jgi:haloalkane dehalogenase